MTGVWTSQNNQEPFINIAIIERDNYSYEDHYSSDFALLISTSSKVDNNKQASSHSKYFRRFRSFALQEPLNEYQLKL